MDDSNPKNNDKPELLADVRVINVGVEPFFTSLKEQGARVIHVDWSPPAGGDEKVMRLLDRLL